MFVWICCFCNHLDQKISELEVFFFSSFLERLFFLNSKLTMSSTQHVCFFFKLSNSGMSELKLIFIWNIYMTECILWFFKHFCRDYRWDSTYVNHLPCHCLGFFNVIDIISPVSTVWCQLSPTNWSDCTANYHRALIINHYLFNQYDLTGNLKLWSWLRVSSKFWKDLLFTIYVYI